MAYSNVCTKFDGKRSTKSYVIHGATSPISSAHIWHVYGAGRCPPILPLIKTKISMCIYIGKDRLWSNFEPG